MDSPGFTEDDRFIVCEIHGCVISDKGTAKDETVSYWVADRDYCYSEVATFVSVPRVNSRVRRRTAAYALADRLNAEDRAASV